jgi:putative endopeptidase
MNNVNKFEINKNIRPQDDFDNYVNGLWIEDNPIPDDQVAWGSFHILRDETTKKLKKLLETETVDPEYQKVVDFYRSGLNEELIEAAGLSPIKPLLDQIDQMQMKSELITIIAKLHSIGVNPLFYIMAPPDADKPEHAIPYFITGGLGLPDRDYYFDEDKAEKRGKYQDFIKNLLQASGDSEEVAKNHADIIYSIEFELAEDTPKNFERNDPDKYFNKTLVTDLQTWTPSLNWTEFFNKMTSQEIPYLSTDKKEFYLRLEKLISNLSLEYLKVFLKYRVLLEFAPYLNKEFEDIHFDFINRTMGGQKVMKPRWKRVLAVINAYSSKIGTLLGKYYAEHYFPPESKERMVELVNNLQVALKKRILDLDWMSSETKEKALLKHEVFRANIGYPDKWPEFGPLQVDPTKPYVENVIASFNFDFKWMVNKFFQPTDMDEWPLHAHSVNAMFHPMKNEITFPAGILQFPFFDPQAHDSINYGGIGVVIGHEMTHSYDNNGSKFNHKGELKNWWMKEDSEKFETKTKYYEDKFSTYTMNGKNINGKLTLGENIADMGGLFTSYDALHHSLQEHPEENRDLQAVDKDFLSSYARIFRSHMRPETLDIRIQTDPHTPSHWRINGGLSHFPPFHRTYKVKKGDKMFSDDFVNIW